MAQEHILLNDIISDHRERMLNLKKYYPFFKLTEVSFSQFKDGKYDILDMGYLIMAILRFFIEENNFKQKDVTYHEYVEFITTCVNRDFGLTVVDSESKEIADYIFDKIKNEGKPFCFEYFDPVDRKKRTSRMKIIESKIIDSTVWYSISADAIEFYLETKEIKDESRISVQQLLLEKMIRSQNFKGGTEVIQRINEEVNRLQIRKNEVLNILTTDVFAGIEAYESFVDIGMRWFEEEEKLFVKNRELIFAARSKAEASKDNGSNESYYRTVDEIYQLEIQLKVAMNKHSELLRACTDMQKLTDEIVKKNKLSRLRSHFDFKNTLNSLIKNDDVDLLGLIIASMLKPKAKKTFNIISMDDCLTYRPQRYDKAETVSKAVAEDIKFVDEIEDERIDNNYRFLMRNLLIYMNKYSTFTLRQFNEVLEQNYTEKIFKNGDYYSFFINLCQKKEYEIGEGASAKESFLDEIIQEEFKDHKRVNFTIAMAEGNEDTILLLDSFEISNITFTRKDNTDNGTEKS
ncbi:hypothetical protein [[Clostridium] fimetarium]|uniref:Uncharacterized protein n=1 Tax=[Clostridium] fimetarium TaxID=99656 RepID=A0A1I0NYP1_9FIRM|nr:hypothetical protein [[Clostridium] fimetarium]SEW07031.1 hypothetical protein SAMN05421659_10417 [[Clostridium] fimetarium]